MKLTPEEHAFYRNIVRDFDSDHAPADKLVRRKFSLPENRYFSVWQDGSVHIDMTRKREVSLPKLSKSDQ